MQLLYLNSNFKIMGNFKLQEGRHQEVFWQGSTENTAEFLAHGGNLRGESPTLETSFFSTHTIKQNFGRHHAS